MELGTISIESFKTKKQREERLKKQSKTPKNMAPSQKV